MAEHKHGDIIDMQIGGAVAVYIGGVYYWSSDMGKLGAISNTGADYDDPVIGNIFSVLKEWEDSQK